VAQILFYDHVKNIAELVTHRPIEPIALV